MRLIRLILFFIGCFAIAVLLIGALFLMLLSTKNIIPDTEVVVSRGDSLRDVSLSLRDSGVIRSALAFQVLVSIERRDRSIVAGTYLFTEPASAHKVADRISTGDYGTTAHSITLPEGVSVKEMADILAERIEGFDTLKFIELALPLEGYLFPDTYFFHDNVTPEEVAQKMQTNFLEKTAGIEISPRLANHTFEELVIMASILEEEALTEDARGIVSGILWSRLEEGIALQVDAAFLYIEELEGRNTYSLTMEDLGIDSPYNTYTNTGLPPTPITNPGLEALHAAANPIESDYLFYLSDTQGNMYYALDFDEHIENRQFLDY